MSILLFHGLYLQLIVLAKLLDLNWNELLTGTGNMDDHILRDLVKEIVFSLVYVGEFVTFLGENGCIELTH